jgi:cysteine synthase A
MLSSKRKIMAKIYDNITQLIGNTPLVALHNIEKLYNLESNLIIKLESLNPGGSVKDRIAKAMIEGAEKDGLLKPVEIQE